MQQLQCCSQYHFAVVDATVVQLLQSILVRNRWVVAHHQRLTTHNFALSTYKVYLAKPLEDKDDVHAKAIGVH